MILTIDVGNTNTVFAVLDHEGAVKGDWRISTNANRTADEYGVWLIQLLDMAGLDRSEISGSVLSSVVPATTFNLTKLCRSYFDCDPLIVGAKDTELGMEILLPRPEEVGADRLVNAVAAYEAHGGPLVVIDFGTATTFDVVDKDGRYCGGVIAPGINLSVEALHAAAAKLPRVAIERPEKVIGTSTVEAMQSGIFWGYVSMIEGMVMRIKGEHGFDMKIIATGGLAPLFGDATKVIQQTDSALTLRGMWEIHKRNEKK